MSERLHDKIIGIGLWVDGKVIQLPQDEMLLSGMYYYLLTESVIS